MAQSDSGASPYPIEGEGTMPPQGESGAAGRKLVLVRAYGSAGIGNASRDEPYLSASGVGASVTRNVVGRLPAVSITSMLRPA